MLSHNGAAAAVRETPRATSTFDDRAQSMLARMLSISDA